MKFTSIKETALYVEELERTRLFYEGKLGFEVIGQKKGRHIFFKVGASVLLCFLSEASLIEDELPPHGASGIIHIAFEVSKEEYQSRKKEISDLGITIIKEQSWPHGLESFYFSDPDGHLLEVVPEGLWGDF